MIPSGISTAVASLALAAVTIGLPAWIALRAPGLADGERSSTRAAAIAPRTLAETGLYADAHELVLAPGVIEFSPQYPLWTDGASKRRWILLPEGTHVDASDADAWRFPAGTKLWKEFAFEQSVETRYMELGANGEWLYATYVWNSDGHEAVLAPERGVRGACESSGGARHDIPSKLDCLACHAASPSPVLGFSALQLSSDRDPLAPHAPTPREGETNLDELVRRGLVRKLPAAHTQRAPRIEASSPVERAALGYLHSNCGACHNSAGPLAELGLDLAYSLERGSNAARTTVGVEARFVGRVDGRETARERIAPARPDASLLFQRVSTRDPFVQMPALGTHVVDARAVALLEQWITHDLANTARATDVARTSRP